MKFQQKLHPFKKLVIRGESSEIVFFFL